MSKEYQGKWRIVEMELWDRDFIDLAGPGYFEFKTKGSGEFQFGAVSGTMDYRLEKSGEAEQLSFSWEGWDEMDPASGRGWAKLVEDRLEGRIYFHHGDDSGFVAKRMSNQRPQATVNAKRPIPASPEAWLHEIAEAYLDAEEALLFGQVSGNEFRESDLFHLAPAVCLKNRGLKPGSQNLEKATVAALSSYVASEKISDGLFVIPRLAFAFCYLAAHYGLDLIDEETVDMVMEYVAAERETLVKMTDGSS